MPENRITLKSPKATNAQPPKSIAENQSGHLNQEKKLDLLIPLLKADRGFKDDKNNKMKKRLRPLSPLENIKLERLKLVAIVLTPEGNKAMIEDFKGQGYIITPGTYIGSNNGRVSRILKNKVVIEEIIQKPDGRITAVTKELRFKKLP